MPTMNQTLKPFRTTATTALAIACTCVMAATHSNAEESAPATAERMIELENATKQVVRQSMIGVTSTRIFYTLAGQQAVVVVHIDNSSTAFPITGTLQMFAADETKEGIEKWINNQHSCGLFIDAAVPVFTSKLHEDAITILAHEPAGMVENQFTNEKHTEYTVKFAIKARHESGRYKLAAFEDEAGVLVKVEST